MVSEITPAKSRSGRGYKISILVFSISEIIPIVLLILVLSTDTICAAWECIPWLIALTVLIIFFSIVLLILFTVYKEIRNQART